MHSILLSDEHEEIHLKCCFQNSFVPVLQDFILKVETHKLFFFIMDCMSHLGIERLNLAAYPNASVKSTIIHVECLNHYPNIHTNITSRKLHILISHSG